MADSCWLLRCRGLLALASAVAVALGSLPNKNRNANNGSRCRKKHSHPGSTNGSPASLISLSLISSTARAIVCSCMAIEVGSLQELLTLPSPEGGVVVRLRDLTVRRRRRRAKDKLCFYIVSDRASGSECSAELRIKAGSEHGEMAPPSAAAAAIRGIVVGSVISLAEGVFSGQWSAEGAGRTLSCTHVELAGAGGGEEGAPVLLFDLNYWELMDELERSAIRRQLRLSYAFNRRSAHAFRVCLGGAGLLGHAVSPAASTAAAPELLGTANTDDEHWSRWDGVRLVDDAEPWRACGGGGGGGGGGRVVYLCAASPNELGAIEAGCTYVIGGLADHRARPGASLERAAAHGLETARLPLERFVKMNTRDSGGGLDVTTLAVVQMMVLRREHADWGEAISRCSALQCAPLRKYVRWLAPYLHLNDAARPADQIAGNVGKDDPHRCQQRCQTPAQARFLGFLRSFVTRHGSASASGRAWSDDGGR